MAFAFRGPGITVFHGLVLQVDVFAFAMIMQEVFSYTVTAQVVIGPTQNAKTAELYACKVGLWVSGCRLSALRLHKHRSACNS